MARAEGLPVGTTAPDVTASLVRPDGSVEDVALSSLVEDRPVLLSFYTADFSPDCISEWCSFRDFEWFASGDHVKVVGASKSGPALHRRFIDQLSLPFPMYSDTDLRLADAFDVVYRALGMFRRSRRSAFLLDEDLTVRYRWLAEHWLDPTRDTPPVGEIHDAIQDELDLDATESFGF